MKALLGLSAAVITALAVPFGLAYYGYIGTAFFAPRYEAIRRDTMIESQYTTGSPLKHRPWRGQHAGAMLTAGERTR